MKSFRGKLVAFALFLTLIVGIPAAYVLAQRPWDELRGMVAQSDSMLSTLSAAVTDDDLQLISRFTLDGVQSTRGFAKTLGQDLYEMDEGPVLDAPSQAFYQLLDFGALSPEQQMREQLNDADEDGDALDYALVQQWYGFWEQAFERHPGALDAFRRLRRVLVTAASTSADSGLSISELYLMLDVADPDKGFFRDNLAFVIESLPWWDNTFPGYAFDMAGNDVRDWRWSYHPKRGGSLGLHHNKFHDPENWYLPEFDTDEWGNWFTVWSARQLGEGEQALFPVFNVDFDAARVAASMRAVAFGLVGSALLIALLLVVMAMVISHWLTAPIRALGEGVDAVMARRFDHRVPITTRDEFEQLIAGFNTMIVSVRQMVNLKDTLSRLLSEELAEQAADKGLTLGGQQVECSVMFTDFAGFSSLSSHMSAAQAVDLLNRYFQAFIPIIKKWGGFPDKYIGDAIVVIFGAPIPLEDHPRRAVACAVELQREIRRINQQQFADDEEFFHMRIGINTGEVVVGAIGCDLKLEFTSIGEATNLANRMESVCPIGHVMLSDATYQRVRDQLPEGTSASEQAQQVHIKGYEDDVPAHPVWVDALRVTKAPGSSVRAKDFYRYSHVD